MAAAPIRGRRFLAAAPRLRAFAVYLCGNANQANELVERTLFKARRQAYAVADGTDITWSLFAVLRAVYSSDLRRRGSAERVGPSRTGEALRGEPRRSRSAPDRPRPP